MENRPQDFVLVLDFGSQYNQLIARRVRECKVYCELMPSGTPLSQIEKMKPKGIILSGGPASVYEKNAPQVSEKLFELGIPVLGICYGMQLMSHALGGSVQWTDKHEYGKTELHVDDEDTLFTGLNPQLICWMSHGDIVATPPEGFKVLAHTENSPVAAMAQPQKNLYAVQFHLEVSHTPWGIEIIKNFLYNVCTCLPAWDNPKIIQSKTSEIQQQVSDKKVLCALSGGVDSAAVAALVSRAVGKQLYCIFVDHGFLRKGEAEQVENTFSKHFHMNLICVDARKRFVEKISGVTDPEEKRKIIGREFIRVFELEAQKLGKIPFLAQGTLYPDVIESMAAGAGSDKIKTHHNVGGLPTKMKFKLVEPLRDLFKDEVRSISADLGLPTEITWRQPFPGPGLAIRIIGEVTEEKLDILREADAIIIDEIKKAGLYRKIWQSFAVLPTIRSVGVMGDHRTYKYPIVLRAVTSEDGMTADWARIPYEVLERISSRVINEVPDVNRVVLDVSTKPPSTIEWE